MKKGELFIYPLNLGTLVSIDKSIFTLLRNQGCKIDIPCLAWVIIGGAKTVLVDTGPCDKDWACRYHRPIEKNSSQNITNALKGLGLAAQDIDLVIFSHLHWDHCFNLEHFSNAKFFVQRDEMEYAISPLPFDKKPYEVGLPGVQPPWMTVFGKTIVLDGDEEIIPGVSVISLPGHTPGSQGVLVDTYEGPWIIAGDNVPFYENWEGDDTLKHIPSGSYQSLFDYQSSLKRLESFGGNILPGHDKKVLINTRYPA